MIAAIEPLVGFSVLVERELAGIAAKLRTKVFAAYLVLSPIFTGNTLLSLVLCNLGKKENNRRVN